MLALALALQLLGPPAAPGPELHLVPPLRFASAEPPADLAPTPPVRREVGVGARPVLAASVGLLAGDGAVLTLAVLTVACALGHSSDGDSSCEALALTTVGLAIFLPPALAVSFARAAGPPGTGRGGAAYAAALLLRVGAYGAVVATGGRAWGLFAASELVLVPYVVARILAGAPQPAGMPPAAPAPAPALAFAVPVRDRAAPR